MATNHRTPRSLSKAQQERAARMDRLMTTQERKTADELKRAAVRLTSGRLSQRIIKRFHPFARRHGAALVPVTPINIDTGRLQRGWRYRRRLKRAGTLYNVAPYTRYILARDGTRYMVPRKFWAAMQSEYRRIRKNFRKQKQEAEK